ncbi:response regulator [Bdellovibrio sp. qaytius]|nr:response regulator [Bdellovibrio sp. qaytius]
MAKTILIVEDDDSIRETLQSVFELEGHKVLTAENGQVGLDILANEPKPSLILLDLMMPVMNGWNFSTALEKDARLSSIPVVIVSAYNDKAINIKCKAILKKPVDINALNDAVEKWSDS